MTTTDELMPRYKVYLQARAPFRAECFENGWAAVLDANGVNWVTFPDKPGAVMTDHETARQIVGELNARQR